MATKSRQDLPLYAKSDAVDLSYNQFRLICKGRVPRWALTMYGEQIRIGKTKDGLYWGEWRGSAVFWASRWYRLPKTVGQRAEKIQAFVEEISKSA